MVADIRGGTIGTRRPGVSLGGRRRLPDAISALEALVVCLVAGGLGLSALAAASLPQQQAPLLLAVVLAPFAAMIVGDLRRLLLAVVVLDIPLSVDVNLSYRQDVAVLGALGGWNVSLTTVALIGLYALWLAAYMTGIGPRPRLALRLAAPLLAYLAIAGAATVVARDAQLSLFEVTLLAQVLLVYVYVVSTVRDRQDVLWIVSLLMVGLTLEGLIMIAQHFVGPAFRIPLLTTSADAGGALAGEMARVPGTLGSSNAAAAYLSLLLAPALALLFADAPRRERWLAGVAFGVGTVALVLTLSRGGWLAFAISVTIVVLLVARRGWVSLPVVGGLVVVGALLAIAFGGVFAARLAGDDAGSAQSRLPLIQLALLIIRDHPLLGIGPNNFALVIPDYAGPGFSRDWLFVVHDEYLRIWAEIGIAGLLALLWFLLRGVWSGWRIWRLHDRLLSPLALGLGAGILGRMVHMLLDIFNNRALVQSLWLVVGLLVAMSRLANAEPAAGQRRGGR